MKKHTLPYLACFVSVIGLLTTGNSFTIEGIDNDSENREPFGRIAKNVFTLMDTMENNATKDFALGHPCNCSDDKPHDSSTRSMAPTQDSESEEKIKQYLDCIETAVAEKGADWHCQNNQVARAIYGQDEYDDNWLGFIDEKITNYEMVDYTGLSPDIFDWRNVNGVDWTTSIKNQDGCGSCTSFGTIGALESVVQLYVGEPFSCDLSEGHLFFCGGGECKKGMTISDAAKYLKMFGVADELCFPYYLQETGCNKMPTNWQKRTIKIENIRPVSPTFECIRNALLTYGPLVTCLDVYEDFYSYTGGIYSYVYGDFIGRHCVTLVGYNNEEGYWICKNSWGTQWGEQGWFRIRYGQGDIGETTFYISGIKGNIHPTPPKNPFPPTGTLNLPCNVTLQWACTDPDGDNIFYDIFMAEDTNISNDDLLKGNHDQNTYSLNDLKDNTTYSWKIIAEDEHGAQYESNVWTFTTIETIPPEVAIITPKNGCFLWGKMQIPLPISTTINIGPVEIQGKAYDASGIQKMDFYINDAHKKSISHEPYVWIYNENSVGLELMELKIIGYDTRGNSACDTLYIRIFNPPTLSHIK